MKYMSEVGIGICHDERWNLTGQLAGLLVAYLFAVFVRGGLAVVSLHFLLVLLERRSSEQAAEKQKWRWQRWWWGGKGTKPG